MSAGCEQPDHVLLIIVGLEHECWHCPVLTASVVGFTRPGRKRLSQMIRADSEALVGWAGQLIPEEDRQLGGIGRIRARPFGPVRSYVSNGCCYCDAVQPTHLLQERATAGRRCLAMTSRTTCTRWRSRSHRGTSWSSTTRRPTRGRCSGRSPGLATGRLLRGPGDQAGPDHPAVAPRLVGSIEPRLETGASVLISEEQLQGWVEARRQGRRPPGLDGSG